MRKLKPGSRRIGGPKTAFLFHPPEYVIESRGLTRKDLEPYLGSRARVAEVLNRARRLTRWRRSTSAE